MGRHTSINWLNIIRSILILFLLIQAGLAGGRDAVENLRLKDFRPKSLDHDQAIATRVKHPVIDLPSYEWRWFAAEGLEDLESILIAIHDEP